MGQIGFLFFSMLGMWLAQDAQNLQGLAQASVPMLAEFWPVGLGDGLNLGNVLLQEILSLC